MCYCRPEIRTAVCDNCAPTMYNVIIRLTAQLAERDAEIAELNQIAKIHSNRYVEKVVHLTKQLTASQQQVAELQQEVERLKESVESWIKTAAENQLKRNEFADIADQLVASQQEVEALTECLNGSSKAVYTAEVFDAQMEKVRKQTARECYEMVCTDEYVFGARNLAKAIAAKFGLEG